MLFPLRIFRISGHSMEPRVRAGSYVLVYTLRKDYQVGDIAAFTYDGKILIKKITAKIDDGYNMRGENNRASLDSTDIGNIGPKHIIGKVILT